LTGHHHLYERFAREYDRDRGRALMERRYLDEMLEHLGERPRILDLGCGSGEPIARYFVERECELTGVDAAPSMVVLCRQRFPNAHWLGADIRSLDLENRFDAIVAWGSFFHLGPDDQRRMFEIFEAHIAPGGLLLFTSGPRAGEATGDFYGHDLFHASLDRQEYESLLRGGGFEVLRHRPEDPDCALHTVWLAQTVR
jgi:cyclopropane fatty-acyl-phospholipid synthase-like methyltransferase